MADPSTISGLVARYRSDSITGLADGVSVPSWPDTSGSGYTATNTTAANQPVYKTGIQNGLPGVLFYTPTNTSMWLDSAWPGGTAAQTLIVVVRPVSATDIRSIRSTSANGGLDFRINGQDKPDIVKRGTTLIATANTAVGTTGSTSMVLSTSYDSSSGAWQIFLNGSSIGSGTNAVSLVATTTRLGHNPGFNEPYRGYMFEVLGWNRVLTAAERASVHSYAQDRYGITVSDYTAGGGANASTFSSTATMAATSAVAASTSAPLSSSATLTASAQATTSGSAPLSVSASMSATTMGGSIGSAPLTASATLTSAPVTVTATGAAPFSSSVTLTSAGTPSVSQVSGFTASPTLSATGSPAAASSATLSATASLGSTATPMPSGQPAFTVSASMTATGAGSTAGTAAAPLSASANLTSTATASATASAGLSASASLSVTLQGTTQFSASASLTATQAGAAAATAGFTVSAGLSAAPAARVAGSAVLSASAVLSSVQAQRAAGLSATATLVAAGPVLGTRVRLGGVSTLRGFYGSTRLVAVYVAGVRVPFAG